MQWKNNKLVGIMGIIALLLCLFFIFIFTFQKRIFEEKEREKNYQKWKSKLILDDKGRVIGANIDGEKKKMRGADL